MFVVRFLSLFVRRRHIGGVWGNGVEIWTGRLFSNLAAGAGWEDDELHAWFLRVEDAAEEG